MNNVQQLIRDANPIQGEPGLLSDDELDALLLLAQTRSGKMDVQELTRPVETDKRRRTGWLVAAAAFAAVIVVGLVTLFASNSTDAPPATIPTTQVPPTSEAPPTTSEATIEVDVPRTVEIEAFDYGYAGFDTELKVGDILELVNSSESEFHSLIVIRFSDDYPVKTVEEVIALDPMDIYMNEFVDSFGSRLHAAPGTKAKGRIRLQTPGTYIALDWIPRNADSEAISRLMNPSTEIMTLPPFEVDGGPIGYQAGMILEFMVSER
jgi:hypothetical protein